MQKDYFRQLVKASVIFPILFISGCGTFDLGMVYSVGGQSVAQRDNDMAVCKVKAYEAANSKERQVGNFVAGLTIIGTPFAIENEKKLQRKIFKECMEEKRYVVELPKEKNTNVATNSQFDTSTNNQDTSVKATDRDPKKVLNETKAENKLPKGVNELIATTASGCKFIYYLKDESLSRMGKPSLNWNGNCKNNFVDGVGDLELTFNGNIFYKIKGEFNNGRMLGFVEGTLSLPNIAFIKFKAEVKDGMNLFGIFEMEGKDGKKVVYSGEAFNVTYEGRGILNDLTQKIVIDGSFKNGKPDGFVVMTNKMTKDKYEGEMSGGLKNGKGIFSFGDGRQAQEGIWKNDILVTKEKIDILSIASRVKSDKDLGDYKNELQKNDDVISKNTIQPLAIDLTSSSPDKDGVVAIRINSNRPLISLKIDTEEFGASPDGNYIINRLPKIGVDSNYKVTGIDGYGSKVEKQISLRRDASSSSQISFPELKPVSLKRVGIRDAVAIVIGVADYKNLPKAEFANDDARVFYDYAVRGFGIKPENIKLLVDSDADEIEIIKTFKTWLPSRVKPTTDVYVFFSGHGLPTQDGQGLLLLPPRADRDFISRTSIQFQEINNDIQAAKPKSVTIFMDACYSGQTRGGESLIASAKPLALKAQINIFPIGFNVFSASQSDQISSSSPDLKHGIFSYYLMKGMEGDADTNKDGKITLGEMQGYLVENVGRQAGMISRKQEPQLIGDPSRVLVDE
jgi:hypothetical protein